MREDLKLKEYAESLNWKIVYSENDFRYKRLNLPLDPLSFEKNNITIWYCGGWKQDSKNLSICTKWQARNKNSNTKVYKPYETRREYNTLKEALDCES